MQRRQLEASERRDWLRLARTANIGPITFRQLISRYKSADKVIDALPDLAQRGGGKRPLTLFPLTHIDDEMARMEKLRGRFVALCEPDYPEALAAIEDAPPVLAVLGDVATLHKRCIGIVGARNASLNGRKMAAKLAKELGEQGLIVVSGMARGIDTAAHEASVDTGTLAVLAGGADVIYPEENATLYNKIVESGAVVSDQPLGGEPRAQLFPKRNRLISGLSLGVVVVEAAKRSGSLITARMALEQGREVFAVPGSPLDPRANGTNDLLRQGAVLTESAEDVLNHIHSARKAPIGTLFGFEEPPGEPPDDRELDRAQARILEHLSPSPVAVDELIRQTGLTSAMVLNVLLELELAGRIERQAGHKVALAA